jgi:hypothetical protein
MAFLPLYLLAALGIFLAPVPLAVAPMACLPTDLAAFPEAFLAPYLPVMAPTAFLLTDLAAFLDLFLAILQAPALEMLPVMSLVRDP